MTNVKGGWQHLSSCTKGNNFERRVHGYGYARARSLPTLGASKGKKRHRSLVLPVWSSVCVLTHPSRPWQHDHDPPTRCCGQRLQYCDGDETLPTRADKIELHGCLVICKTQQHLTLALAYKVVHFFSTGLMGLHCNYDVPECHASHRTETETALVCIDSVCLRGFCEILLQCTSTNRTWLPTALYSSAPCAL